MKYCEQNCGNIVLNEKNRFCSVSCKNTYINIISKQKRSEKISKSWDYGNRRSKIFEIIVKSECESCLKMFEYTKRVNCTEENQNKIKYVRRLCDGCNSKLRKAVGSKVGKITGPVNIKKAHEVPPKKGKESPRFKEKIKLTCPICSIVFEVIPAMKDHRKCCSMECNKQSRRNGFLGNKNPKWKNGNSYNGYGGKFTKDLKEIVRERDGRICQKCGMLEIEHKQKYNQRLVVHHINYIKEDCLQTNLISLCVSCHNKIAPKNEDFHKSYFTNLIKEKYNKQEALIA